MDNQFNKVFISYAKEDIESAQRIYTFLEENNFQPWLDKKKLLVGVDWDNEIKTALAKSDFIILLLSNTSVGKRGYVQREFKIALDYVQNKLDSDIFIIPIKLDNCEVPLNLQKYQYIDIDKSEALEEILKALIYQQDKLIEFDVQAKKKRNKD